MFVEDELNSCCDVGDACKLIQRWQVQRVRKEAKRAARLQGRDAAAAGAAPGAGRAAARGAAPGAGRAAAGGAAPGAGRAAVGGAASGAGRAAVGGAAPGAGRAAVEGAAPGPGRAAARGAAPGPGRVAAGGAGAAAKLPPGVEQVCAFAVPQNRAGLDDAVGSDRDFWLARKGRAVRGTSGRVVRV
jgi:hypothetical protein